MKYMIYGILLLAVTAFADSKKGIDFCGKVEDPNERLECLKGLYTERKNDLENVYQQAFTYIQQTEVKKLIKNYWTTDLKKAQGQWLKFREEECTGLAKYEYWGIKTEHESALLCKIEKTGKRTKELKQRYDIKRVPEKPSDMPGPDQVNVPLLYGKIIKSPATPGTVVQTGVACPATTDILVSREAKSRKKGINPGPALMDTNLTTSWLTESTGPGVGAWVEFKINSLTNGITDFLTQGFHIVNGRAASDTIWTAHGRVKEMVAYLNGKPIFKVLLQNSPKVQEFSFDTVQKYKDWNYRKGDKIRFVISKVFPGSRYKTTYLSTFVPVCK